MALKISADVRRALDALAYVRQDQVPFATALALTNTARIARENVRSSITERFKSRGSSGSFLKQGIDFQKATKNKLEATVYDKDWFMGLQEEGGTKKPAAAPELAIPGLEYQGQQFRPKLAQLLQQPATFMSTLADGTPFIGRRTGPESHPLTVLAILRRSVEVHPRFGMAETVGRTVETSFGQEFQRAAIVAMRTAR